MFELLEVNRFSVKVTDVIDGDTFVGDIHIFPFGITLTNQHFRVYGVDTPERKEEGYYEATEFTAHLIHDKELTVKVIEKDAFGRWLTTVMIDEYNTLNDLLLTEGHAVKWVKGQKKKVEV
ncbi:thermonuclease family protein [Bacillus toyonensis]|uniref:thermonuclease family protein n=1 Tax=Bacillus toyonensis TaxID=155322 RepID=UPI000BF15B48|nr:thermonuclease family protein [Bacillus toyonensis]PEL24362.1 nuclease [Bacillus toyonensis]